MGPYGTTWDLNRTIWDRIDPYGTIWDHKWKRMRPYENIEGPHRTIKGLYETVRNLMGQYGSV